MRRSRKAAAVIMAGVMAASAAGCSGSGSGAGNGASGDKTYKVGICQLVQHDALDAATKGLMDALK